MTPLGLFGLEPAGNGPTYLVACGPAAELTLVLLWATKMISLCPSKDLEMLIHEKRYEKCERTHIRNEGDQWKYIGSLILLAVLLYQSASSGLFTFGGEASRVRQ